MTRRICGISRPLVSSPPSPRVKWKYVTASRWQSKSGRGSVLISMRKLCYLFEHVKLCMRNMLTAFDGVWWGEKVEGWNGRGRERERERWRRRRTRVWARRRAWFVGVVERTNKGERERKRNRKSERKRERESAEPKGCTSLSNVIETTIKYERSTMNAPNNPELFASSIRAGLKTKGGPASTLSLEGRAKIWLNYKLQAVLPPASSKFASSRERSTITLFDRGDRLTRIFGSFREAIELYLSEFTDKGDSVDLGNL